MVWLSSEFYYAKFIYANDDSFFWCVGRPHARTQSHRTNSKNPNWIMRLICINLYFIAFSFSCAETIAVRRCVSVGNASRRSRYAACTQVNKQNWYSMAMPATFLVLGARCDLTTCDWVPHNRTNAICVDCGQCHDADKCTRVFSAYLFCEKAVSKHLFCTFATGDLRIRKYFGRLMWMCSNVTWSGRSHGEGRAIRSCVYRVLSTVAAVRTAVVSSNQCRISCNGQAIQGNFSNL